MLLKAKKYAAIGMVMAVLLSIVSACTPASVDITPGSTPDTQAMTTPEITAEPTEEPTAKPTPKPTMTPAPTPIGEPKRLVYAEGDEMPEYDDSVYDEYDIVTIYYPDGNSREEDPVARIREITGGEMAQQVMECSGANVAIRNSLDYVSHAGRITLTGWPKTETPLPTDAITRKEIDIRGARTSAGEFEEAIDLIYTKKVDIAKILTKTISIDEAPDTIRDIEKNPGNYMKVIVNVGDR